MPKIKRTAKNVAVLFAGDIGSRLIGFITTAYLARILGVTNFGLISIGLAVLTYILTISSNGLPTLGVRRVINNEGDEPVSDFISARIIFSAVTIVLTTIIITFFIKSIQVRIIILAYSLYLLPTAFLLDWYFRAKERMGLIVSGRLLGMICYLVFILIFVKSDKGVNRVAYSWFMNGLVVSLFLIFMYIRQGKGIKIHFSFYKVKSLFCEAFPLGLAEIIIQVTLHFPPILLAMVMTIRETGLYSAAAKLVVIFLIIDRVFCFSFFPAISRCVKRTPERLNQVFNQTLRWIVIIIILFGFLGILLGKYLVLFVFGKEYLSSVLIFQTIMSYFMITLINSVFTFTLIALRQEKAYTFSLFIGSIVFFVSAWFLLKIFGPAGMGVGLGIYQAVVLLIMNNKLKKLLDTKFLKIIVLPIIVSVSIFLPLIFIVDLNLIFKTLVILICLIPISQLIGIKREELKFLINKII